MIMISSFLCATRLSVIHHILEVHEANLQGPTTETGHLHVWLFIFVMTNPTLSQFPRWWSYFRTHLMERKASWHAFRNGQRSLLQLEFTSDSSLEGRISKKLIHKQHKMIPHPSNYTSPMWSKSFRISNYMPQSNAREMAFLSWVLNR